MVTQLSQCDIDPNESYTDRIERPLHKSLFLLTLFDSLLDETRSVHGGTVKALHWQPCRPAWGKR